MKFASIVNYIQAVTLVHKLRNIEPPCVSSHAVRLTLQGAKRRLGSNPNPRRPVTIEILQRMFKCLDINVKIHVMFWASALLLFRSLLRVSHVIDSPHTLTVNDISWSEEGYDIKVRSSKTSNVERVIPVRQINRKELCSVFWLKRWFSISRCKGNMPLFSVSGPKALSYSNFSRLLSNLLSSANVKSKITTHSFRQGGASFLSSIGVPLPKIKERGGGWKSNDVYLYISENFREKVQREKLVAAAIDLNC